ncbi:DNA polymerase III subunit epsilon [Shewanella sp. NKUCC01_JLK]|uniref:exonuclease domain-containing protein n=1 Tax=Shewanella sp. NKUCC01_JLK TaxID=2842123 RepID=UPI001C5AA8D5|nr:exonuclease domain-containing protein [Shewanella sp. NKUCC01_JLK]MBW3514937.1 DNA polymerase III subunit epsilon [Shewanella sp. NKUCC01_JLK]
MDDLTADFLVRHPYIPTKFIALDVETTGLDAGIDRVIELAAIKFDLRKNDHIVFDTLINPNVKISPKITSLTGITNLMLTDKPSFGTIANELKEFIGDLPIVVYNAKFDKGFIQEEFANLGIFFGNKFLCAMKLSKVAFSLPNYKLATVAEHCNIQLDEAHRAKADAIAAGRVFMCAAVTLGHINENPPKKAYTKSSGTDHRSYPPNELGPMFGQTIVFTGELSMTRAEAFAAVSEIGFEIKNSITKRTNYLVVGDQDLSVVGQSGLSSKQIRVGVLRESGVNIKVINETELYKILNSITR